MKTPENESTGKFPKKPLKQETPEPMNFHKVVGGIASTYSSAYSGGTVHNNVRRSQEYAVPKEVRIYQHVNGRSELTDGPPSYRVDRFSWRLKNQGEKAQRSSYFIEHSDGPRAS